MIYNSYRYATIFLTSQPYTTLRNKASNLAKNEKGLTNVGLVAYARGMFWD